MSRKVWYDGAWVSLDAPAGGVAYDQAPNLLADGADLATATQPLLTAVASATPHTPGAWVEVFASLSAPAAGLQMFLPSDTSTASTDTSTLLEVGIGASGAEVVWATYPVGWTLGGRSITLPGHIPAGSRVTARVRSAVASKSFPWQCRALAARSLPLAAPTTVGVNLATSSGTTLTPPGSVNTKGAWTVIGGPTSTASNVLAIGIQGTGSTYGNAEMLLDLGVGPVGQEVVVVPNVSIAAGVSESVRARNPLTVGVAIPAGSTVSARFARSTGVPTLSVSLITA